MATAKVIIKGENQISGAVRVAKNDLACQTIWELIKRTFEWDTIKDLFLTDIENITTTIKFILENLTTTVADVVDGITSGIPLSWHSVLPWFS